MGWGGSEEGKDGGGLVWGYWGAEFRFWIDFVGGANRGCREIRCGCGRKTEVRNTPKCLGGAAFSKIEMALISGQGSLRMSIFYIRDFCKFEIAVVQCYKK